MINIQTLQTKLKILFAGYYDEHILTMSDFINKRQTLHMVPLNVYYRSLSFDRINLKRFFLCLSFDAPKYYLIRQAIEQWNDTV